MNPVWRLFDRTGLAPILRSAYFTLLAAPRGWRYRARAGGATAEFATSTWYEFKRARHLHGERRVVESFLATLATDDVVWDVGANVGMYACFAARTLPSGTVVGFEPIPVNRRRLADNLTANVPGSDSGSGSGSDSRSGSDSDPGSGPDHGPADGVRWRTSPYALWDTDEPGRMAFGHDRSRRTDPGAGHHYLTDGDGWIGVDCRRGETLVAGGLPAPDVVKIDVQGAELQVLRGMGDLLDDVRAVYVEIHREKSGRYGTSAEGIEAFLRRSGFSLSRFGAPETYRHGVYHVLASRAVGDSDPGGTGVEADAGRGSVAVEGVDGGAEERGFDGEMSGTGERGT